MKTLTNLTKRYFRIILQILFFSCLIFQFKFGVAIWVSVSILFIFFGRIYCGFLCTRGSYQDWIGSLGKKIFKNKFDNFIPEKIDNILSYLRYVAMIAYGFFATSFFASKILDTIGGPNTNSLVNIIFSRKVVGTAIIVSLIEFTILSLLISRPYCRYLCSGSVQAGALSFAKIFKLRRNPDVCTNCHKCENICPMDVQITKMETVCDGRCVSCFQCIGSNGCPNKKALYLDMHPIRTFLNSKNKNQDIKVPEINKIRQIR
ncbi:4Fe-4S binding protein [Clostridium tyrobutyricum]|uniref:4Fe-4S binding protein n=1 Tax=Clostridium tyrobutyricum TaxID=1519 RepID=UPI001A9A8F01|nr:4Fe-4S binding protein [Clostridium tyrobutyricum]